MDGRELSPESPAWAKDFIKNFPEEVYYSVSDAMQMMKDYFDGKLKYEDCPWPMKEAIGTYEIKQMLRSISARMIRERA